jgi:hypothetical protein
MRAVIVLVLCAAACSTDFAPPSRLEGLRVLDVSADATYAAPGSTVNMQMLAIDTQNRPIAVDWFAGCVNPAGDQPDGCASELDSGAASGTGTSFSYTLPNDIISSRPPPVDDSTPYGLAYVYFVASAAESSVTGYMPIYAYDALTNNAPQITDVHVDATVKACTKKKLDDCPDIHVEVVVDPSQSEPDIDQPHEILWAAFFATVGEFVSDTQQICDNDGIIRPLKDSRGEWHVDPGYTGPATIYVVLYDSRGGSTWVQKDVLVDVP